MSAGGRIEFVGELAGRWWKFLDSFNIQTPALVVGKWCWYLVRYWFGFSEFPARQLFGPGACCSDNHKTSGPGRREISHVCPVTGVSP